MRVAIIENTENSPLGQIGAALREADAEIQLFRPWAGEALPDGHYHDALVVLGGEQSARADDTHPYLPDLVRLTRRMAVADKAVLGVCLGAQLLARAFGAENLLGVTPEFGWHQIRVTKDGLSDPIMSVLPGAFTAFQWHRDTFSLPDGAIRLARNAAVGNQCFRIGRAAYGMQFHFEASRAVVENWCRDFPEAIEMISPGWVDAYPLQAAEHGPEADAAGLAIARAWISLI
ncbi:MAG: type 1 glutamine amidotransferase [Paracoccaceae bacterium]